MSEITWINLVYIENCSQLLKVGEIPVVPQLKISRGSCAYVNMYS